MATGTNLLDKNYKIRQGENRAVALYLINRFTETGEPVRRADIQRIEYTIWRRAEQYTSEDVPVDEIVEGHDNNEIPVDDVIFDTPLNDPVDNMPYNFVWIVPTLDNDDNDITPFKAAGIYDIVIRFVPFLGGNRHAVNKTIRVEVS